MTHQHEALLNWPNNQSISTAVQAMVALHSGHQDPAHDFPNAQEISDQAPDLEGLIQEHMDNYDMPQYLLEQLHREQARIAQDVLLKLPKNQKDRLYQKFLEHTQ